MSQTDTSMTEWLSEHPRMMGALFTLVLLLSQAGSVAGSQAATAGP